MPNDRSPWWWLCGFSNHSGWGNLCTMVPHHHCIYHFRILFRLSRRRRHNVRRWPVCMLRSMTTNPHFRSVFQNNNIHRYSCGCIRAHFQKHYSTMLSLPPFPWRMSVSPIPHTMFCFQLCLVYMMLLNPHWSHYHWCFVSLTTPGTFLHFPHFPWITGLLNCMLATCMFVYMCMSLWHCFV